MVNYLVGGIILLIICSSLTYIYKAKKSGVKCIGCSSGKQCSGHCSTSGSCSHAKG